MSRARGAWLEGPATGGAPAGRPATVLGVIRLALAIALVSGTLQGCSSSPPTPAPAAPPPTSVAKSSDALSLVVTTVDESEGQGPAAERLFTERVAASRRLLVGPPRDPDRALAVTLVVGKSEARGGDLAQKVVLVGKLPSGCEVLRIERALTLPGGKADRAADRDELLRTGIGSLFERLEEVAPKVGPQMTCIATR